MNILLLGSFVTLGMITFCLAAYIVFGFATGSFIANKIEVRRYAYEYINNKPSNIYNLAISSFNFSESKWK